MLAAVKTISTLKWSVEQMLKKMPMASKIGMQLEGN
jgi:hypothetical protein